MAYSVFTCWRGSQGSEETSVDYETRKALRLDTAADALEAALALGRPTAVLNRLPAVCELVEGLEECLIEIEVSE